MSKWPRIFYTLLNLPLRLLVKSKPIPTDPCVESGLDSSCPMMYLLPYYSNVDLLVLRKQCLAHELPDPLEPLDIDGVTLPRYVFIDNGPHLFPHHKICDQSVKLFHNCLDLHQLNPQLDIQLIPVSVMFGRAPGREKDEMDIPPLRLHNGLQKFFAVCWLGRDSFVRFSPSVSFRYIVQNYGTDASIALKLARVARMHFARQRLAATGPRIPLRQELFNKLLTSKALSRAIEDEANSKKITPERARKHAVIMLEEIAANFSYEVLRLTDRVLSFTWNRLYHGINVHNVERVRQLAHDGHELVYVPCHRSHMDYLLLSYVLYHQGLVPPHIAAGVNLDFWPAGPIFRRLGAFFIRRSFRGNKLYSTVFREYLAELFSRGYSVEYFMEGGRSRTGRLLEPKTGTLSMTIQAMLRGGSRPITLIPVYIGYEHVMEVATYSKELHGASKAKENLLQMLRGLCKLRNLGQGYVNFGEPISLISSLNQLIPNWRDDINPIEDIRPTWLTTAANQIAGEVMIHINSAAAANAMNLCCTALLASRQHSLTREQLCQQLECYLQLLRQVPYSSQATVPDASPQQLVDHALRLNKFHIKQDTIGDIIILPAQQAALLTYYRNNILHMLVIPSLLASIILQNNGINRQQLPQHLAAIYPLLQAELFLHWQPKQLPEIIDALLQEFSRQRLITLDQQQRIYSNTEKKHNLQLLAASISETIQRYAITFWLLSNQPTINRATLEKESRTLAKRLSALHGINAPEFFDKAVFTTLVLTLRSGGYINDNPESNINNDTNNTADSNRKPQLKSASLIYQQLAQLMPHDIRQTIENTAASAENK